MMVERIHRGPGVYIVTLSNRELISVNADRPRIAEKCIKVNRLNCKFGKAKNLQARRNNYFKTFGVNNVHFHPIAAINNPEVVEAHIAAALLPYRMRGATGRLNEWLAGISPLEVEAAVFSALAHSGLEYQRLGGVNIE